MSSHTLTTTVGSLTSDSTAVVNTLVERDASGNATLNTLTASVALITSGSLFLKNSPKTASFSADTGATVYNVDTTSGSVTCTLPAVASSTDQVYIFVKTVSANNFVLDGAGSETINGATTKTTAGQYAAAILWCNGTVWYAILIGTWT